MDGSTSPQALAESGALPQGRGSGFVKRKGVQSVSSQQLGHSLHRLPQCSETYVLSTLNNEISEVWDLSEFGHAITRDR